MNFKNDKYYIDKFFEFAGIAASAVAFALFIVLCFAMA